MAQRKDIQTTRVLDHICCGLDVHKKVLPHVCWWLEPVERKMLKSVNLAPSQETLLPCGTGYRKVDVRWS